MEGILKMQNGCISGDRENLGLTIAATVLQLILLQGHLTKPKAIKKLK